MKAQLFLITEDNLILDIESLMQKHPPVRVLSLMQEMMQERESTVMDYLTLDVTSRELDKALSEWFRLYMAMHSLKRDMVKESDLSQFSL